jgi:hypothetical protein
MATDVLVEKAQTESTPEGRQEMTIESGRLGNDFFGIETKEEEKPVAAVQPEVKPVEQKAEIKPEEKPPADVVKTWHKDYGWETEAAAKAEIEQLRKLKEQAPQEQKFENEQSKHIHELLRQGKTKEVIDFYQTQDKLNALTATEVNDDTAEDILKLALELKHKDAGLSKSEIEYKYNKEFGLPKEPIRREDELDEEFDARKAEWQEKVSDIKMNRRMEAKLAKPELDKLKTQIVLPDISQSSEQKPPTQEELDKAKKYDDDYLNSVEASVKIFNGVSVAVKNEVVDFSVEFGATNEDKATLATLMKDFQKTGYDANGLFADLWVNEDKTLKTNEMIEDYYLIKNKKALFTKIANDSANKAVESYIKGKKNINVNETSNQGTAEIRNEDKTEMDVIRDSFFG